MLFYPVVALQFFSMEHEVLHVKWARLLSRNHIREIVMDLDSDEDKYNASDESEDEEEPRPPSQRSTISHPPSPGYSASSSEDKDDGNVAGQQPQPCQWTLPPKPRRHVVHTFTGTPQQEKQ